MKKITNFRRATILLVIAALVSAAFMCGRGQALPGGQPPAGQPPAGQPPAEQPPVDQPPADQPPADQPPADQAPGAQGEVDLRFTNTGVTETSPGNVAVALSFRNRGAGTVTSSFTVRWLPHGKSDEVGCSWDIAAAEIVNERTVNCTYTYKVSGEMHWQAILDADEDVTETNEGNNDVKGTVTVSKAGPGGGQIAAPTNCTWRLASVPNIIILEWEYGDVSGIDGFIIYLATTDVVVWIGPSNRSYTIPNLALSTQYHYDVRAYKGNQQSPVDACAVDATTGQ